VVASRRNWGKVRQIRSGRYQASYVHGGVWGVAEGTRFTALSTFDTSGDAWAWIGRERDLIDRGTWTPPFERYQQLEKERIEEERARRAAEGGRQPEQAIRRRLPECGIPGER